MYGSKVRQGLKDLAKFTDTTNVGIQDLPVVSEKDFSVSTSLGKGQVVHERLPFAVFSILKVGEDFPKEKW